MKNIPCLLFHKWSKPKDGIIQCKRCGKKQKSYTVGEYLEDHKGHTLKCKMCRSIFILVMMFICTLFILLYMITSIAFDLMFRLL